MVSIVAEPFAIPRVLLCSASKIPPTGIAKALWAKKVNASKTTENLSHFLDTIFLPPIKNGE
jgi:hypothetical protein